MDREIETPCLKEELQTLDDFIASGLEIAGQDLLEPLDSMDVWMNTEELNGWLADVVLDYHATGRQMLLIRVAVERAKQRLADLERQARGDRELGGLMANFAPQIRERINALKEIRFILMDRQDIQRTEIEAIRTALFSLRPPF